VRAAGKVVEGPVEGSLDDKDEDVDDEATPIWIGGYQDQVRLALFVWLLGFSGL
jgi:hypothetical protein